MVAVPFRGDAPGFWIEAHEVTRGEYDLFRAAAGQGVPPPGDALRRGSEPVLSVPHALAVEYARWLARLTGRPYRLPSEAEWEQACRAGEEEERPLAQRAWFAGNAAARPHPVGTRGADRLGLFDMLGNVAECRRRDAALPASRRPRVIAKGGSWADPVEARDAARRRRESESTGGGGATRVGFRVMRPY